jgi:hypothetical protein
VAAIFGQEVLNQLGQWPENRERLRGDAAVDDPEVLDFESERFHARLV